MAVHKELNAVRLAADFIVLQRPFTMEELRVATKSLLLHVAGYLNTAQDTDDWKSVYYLHIIEWTLPSEFLRLAYSSLNANSDMSAWEMCQEGYGLDKGQLPIN